MGERRKGREGVDRGKREKSLTKGANILLHMQV